MRLTMTTTTSKSLRCDKTKLGRPPNIGSLVFLEDGERSASCFRFTMLKTHLGYHANERLVK